MYNQLSKITEIKWIYNRLIEIGFDLFDHTRVPVFVKKLCGTGGGLTVDYDGVSEVGS